MSACVIWLDSEHANIFKISAAGIENKKMARHTINPVGSHFDAHKHNAEEHFFQKIAAEVGDVEELLVFGAGMAKTHFKTHLEKHNTQLTKHLVGVEPLDKLTDNQILEASRKFFKKYNMFHSAV